MSADWTSWERVAAATLASLQGRTLRAAGPRGVAFTVEVESRWRLTSGSDPGIAVDIVGLTAKSGEGKRSPRAGILQPRIELAPVARDAGISVPQIGVPVLELGGDPADIGAKPLRTVRAHVVDEWRQ